MRTFGLHHFNIALVAALVAALVVATPVAAQQSADPAPTARIIPARCSDAACGGDFQLAIVTALYPYYDGSVRGPGVLTLVIENRGHQAAPISALEVAPLTRFATYTAARRAPVAALMPGERTVVEIPLELDANGGAPCISISVSPGFVPTPTERQVFASASASTDTESPSDPPPFVSFIGDDGF